MTPDAPRNHSAGHRTGHPALDHCPDVLPELVLFDCDGVIVDTEPATLSAMTGWLNHLGISMDFDRATRELKGRHIRLIQAWAEEQLGVSIPGFIEGYRARMYASFALGIDPMPGIVDALGALDAAGIPHCVASNGPMAKMAASLTGAKLLDRLGGIRELDTLDRDPRPARIFTADDVPNPKPAPDLFLHAARTLGVDPSRCVVVEDSPSGIVAALAAGMAAVGCVDLTPAEALFEAGAHAVIETPAGLVDLLGLVARR